MEVTMCIKLVVPYIHLEISRLEMMAILVHAKSVIHTINIHSLGSVWFINNDKKKHLC
jgi:hypothetical protein